MENINLIHIREKRDYFVEKIFPMKYMMCLAKLNGLCKKSEKTTLPCVQLSYQII